MRGEREWQGVGDILPKMKHGMKCEEKCELVRKQAKK
jgi:hypothetical protein